MKEPMENKIPIYLYENNESLVYTQNVILELAEYLITHIDIIQFDFRPYYYKCLTKLIKRGEFDLGHLMIQS